MTAAVLRAVLALAGRAAALAGEGRLPLTVMNGETWEACGDPHAMRAWLLARTTLATPRRLRLWACAFCRLRPAFAHLSAPGFRPKLLDAIEDAAEAEGTPEASRALRAVRDARGVTLVHATGPETLQGGRVPAGVLWAAADDADAGLGEWLRCPQLRQGRLLAGLACHAGRCVFGDAAKVLPCDVRYPGPGPGRPPVCRAHGVEVKASADGRGEVCPARRNGPKPEWLAWNGGAARKLAEAIHRDRAYDRMPVLADALEEAGCDDAGILAHCRRRAEVVCGRCKGVGWHAGGKVSREDWEKWPSKGACPDCLGFPRRPAPHVRGCWVLDLMTGRA